MAKLSVDRGRSVSLMEQMFSKNAVQDVMPDKAALLSRKRYNVGSFS